MLCDGTKSDLPLCFSNTQPGKTLARKDCEIENVRFCTAEDSKCREARSVVLNDLYITLILFFQHAL
jgi:hypothetical protein